MNFEKFSLVNRSRCETGFNHSMKSWSIAEWTNAVAGEAGEACNLAKKIIRHRDNVAGNIKLEDKDIKDLQSRLTKELADVIIYADLTIQSLGYSTPQVLIQTFNEKSHALRIQEFTED